MDNTQKILFLEQKINRLELVVVGITILLRSTLSIPHGLDELLRNFEGGRDLEDLEEMEEQL